MDEFSFPKDGRADNMSRKVLYVATVVRRHIVTFHIPYLKMIKDMGWLTAVAARNDYDSPEECIIPYCDKYFTIPFERNPLSLNNIRAFKQLKKVIDTERFDIVHVHTPVGALLGRLAARKYRRTGLKVVYTAHGFHFYSGAPIVNWLFFYPVEWFLARYTDVLITINQEDFKRAKGFKAKEVVYIPGVGVDVDYYAKTSCDRMLKRQSIGLTGDDYIILSVGELSKNKNHSLVIEALALLREWGKIDGLHYIICGEGPLKTSLEQLIESLELQEHVMLLGYRNDVNELLNVSDAFAFPSIREGLPLSLMEAMASGIPVVCTKNRGSTDLVSDGETALFANDAETFAECIKRLKDDKVFASKLAYEAKKRVKDYDICSTVSQVKSIYMKLTDNS